MWAAETAKCSFLLFSASYLLPLQFRLQSPFLWKPSVPTVGLESLPCASWEDLISYSSLVVRLELLTLSILVGMRDPRLGNHIPNLSVRTFGGDLPWMWASAVRKLGAQREWKGEMEKTLKHRHHVSLLLACWDVTSSALPCPSLHHQPTSLKLWATLKPSTVSQSNKTVILHKWPVYIRFPTSATPWDLRPVLSKRYFQCSS